MSFDYQPHLVGDLLEVRPLEAHDLDALYEIARDPLLWEQHPEPTRALRSGFARFFAEQLASGGGLAVVDRSDGRLIGSSRYHAYDEERSEVEIGWTFLARAYWGGAANRELKGSCSTTRSATYGVSSSTSARETSAPSGPSSSSVRDVRARARAVATARASSSPSIALTIAHSGVRAGSPSAAGKARRHRHDPARRHSTARAL